MTNFRFRGRIHTSIVCAVLLGASTAHADQINWVANGDGIFQDAGNWSPAQVPGVNDLVVLDQPAANSTITFTGDVETLSFEMDSGTFTFDLGGFTYTLNDIAAPLNFVGPGSYDLTTRNGMVSAGSAFVFANGTWRIEDATVELPLGGLQMSSGGTVVIGDQGEVVADGGTFTSAGSTLRIADGGALRTSFFNPNGTIDWQPGGTLELLVEDVLIVDGGDFGTTLAVSDGRVLIGNAARVESTIVTALLEVDDGDVAIDGAFGIAAGFSTFGHLAVRGDAPGAGQVTIGGDLTVAGGGGVGELDVESGGSVDVAGEMLVGIDGLVDLKPGGATVVSVLRNSGNVDQQGGLLRVGDLPAGPGGFIVSSTAPTDGVESDGQIVTQDGHIGPGVGGYGLLDNYGDWFCFGPIAIGRADGLAASARLVVDGGFVQSAAAITVHPDGELRIVDGGNVVAPNIQADGLLLGDESVQAALVNNGRVDPVTPDAALDLGLPSPASLGVNGSYEQTGGGTLAIALASLAEFDQLLVSGPVQLGGTLEVSLLDGFTPQEEDTFEIISVTDGTSAVSDRFDAIPSEYLAYYGSDTVTIWYAGPCPQDFDDSGSVGFPDLTSLLAQWGECPLVCRWDLDGDGMVGFTDLTSLLVAWGPCS